MFLWCAVSQNGQAVHGAGTCKGQERGDQGRIAWAYAILLRLLYLIPTPVSKSKVSWVHGPCASAVAAAASTSRAATMTAIVFPVPVGKFLRSARTGTERQQARDACQSFSSAR